MTELFGKESAIAIQKTTEAAQNFGGFFSKHFGGSVEQWAGLWEDKLRYRRWENQLALMQKAEEKMRALGLNGKCHPLSLKIGVPLLEAASLEDDEYLRELWANLLINSVKHKDCLVHPAFIQVLQNLLPQEAKLLEYASKHSKKGVLIIFEESHYYNSEPDSMEKQKLKLAIASGLEFSEPNQVFTWFDNLLRLKLLQSQNSHESYYKEGDYNSEFHGAEEPSIVTTYYEKISFTAFGQSFISAVMLP